MDSAVLWGPGPAMAGSRGHGVAGASTGDLVWELGGMMWEGHGICGVEAAVGLFGDLLGS